MVAKRLGSRGVACPLGWARYVWLRMGLLDRALDASIALSFDRSGFERHAKRFDAGDLEVSMEGRTCLVTGANRGLGLALATGLAKRRATVHLLCRSESRGRAARDQIVQLTGNEAVHVHEVDMASLASIRGFVERFDAPAVDVLVHNAGLLPAQRSLSPEGFELTVAVHVLGPFALTEGLAPRLSGGRVIFVTSGGMYAKRLDVDSMLDTSGRYDGVSAYAMTKRAQVVLAEQWAERLRASGTVVHSMHPGWAATPGVRTSLPRFWKAMEGRLRTPEQGADTALWLAVADEPMRSTGKLWFDREPAATYRLPFTRESAQQRERLWQLGRSFVGDDLDD